jgi:hypothetical protein
VKCDVHKVVEKSGIESSLLKLLGRSHSLKSQCVQAIEGFVERPLSPRHLILEISDGTQTLPTRPRDIEYTPFHFGLKLSECYMPYSVLLAVVYMIFKNLDTAVV